MARAVCAAAVHAMNHDSTTAPDAGQGQRLLLDVGEVRDRLRLRLLAAVPAFAGGLWLLGAGEGLLLRLLAGSGLVFALLWVVLARRAISQIGRREEHYLDIHADGFTIRNGTRTRSVGWTEVEAVEIDEDRLVVQVRLRGQKPVAVEPHFGALGLRELGEVLESARARAGAGSDPGMRSRQS